MAEMVDIVDEKDMVIGKASRQEAHNGWLLHRVVHVFVLNSKGEIYVQKRSQKMDTNPGLWTSSAAGHVGSGEDYLEAADRELKEELGVEADLKGICTIPVHDPNHNQLIKYFAAVHDGPFRTNKDEIETAEFVKTGTLKKDIASGARKFTPAFLAGFRKFCEARRL